VATDAETTWKLLLDNQSGIRTLDDPFVEEFDLPVWAVLTPSITETGDLR
jgi:hypothetical protein